MGACRPDKVNFYEFHEQYLKGKKASKSRAKGILGTKFQKFIYDEFNIPEKKIPHCSLWDIPVEFNVFSDMPVNIKSGGFGNAIYFADLNRQYNIDEDFELVIGPWEMYFGKPRISNIFHVIVDKNVWRKEVWGYDFPYEEIIELKEYIEALSPQLNGAEKDEEREFCNAVNADIMTRVSGAVNSHVKIGTASTNPYYCQRRLQCGIALDDLNRILNINLRERADKHVLWGKEIILSKIDLN